MNRMFAILIFATVVTLAIKRAVESPSKTDSTQPIETDPSQSVIAALPSVEVSPPQYELIGLKEDIPGRTTLNEFKARSPAATTARWSLPLGPGVSEWQNGTKTIADVPWVFVTHAFVDGTLAEISGSVNFWDGIKVMLALEEKYGPGKCNGEKIRVWNTAQSSVTLVIPDDSKDDFRIDFAHKKSVAEMKKRNDDARRLQRGKEMNKAARDL